jgi:D-arabinose 5-phosphate isomerase GutQ
MQGEKKINIFELAKKIMQQEASTILDLAEGLGEPFSQCAEILSNCPGVIWVTAVGTSASVATRFAHILTCCGARSMFLSPSDGLHGHTGVIQPEDIFIAMSRGGESQEVIQMVNIGNERGAKTIALVHNTESTLASSSQYILPIPSKQEYELMGYLATTSTIAFSAVCDALCAVVLEVKGYTLEQFSKTHPGGAVGQAFDAKTKV